MPTYTYRCAKCGAETEAFQSMSDPPLKRCKACRGALRRTFHPVGIVLKGPGFHRNDYATSKSGRSSSEGEKAEKTAEKKESSSSDTKSETKSESKSETKSDAKTGSTD